ncbi:hypothetical protein DERP_014078 [Dermatophagoides pteronyssinus]|uniref:Uncharacterized protein n=1 Tax=Dermatophagoides pteronyssinus TaxID=6956 RepID=A0ABQ8J6C3_DERPT|nr:hypothetical protein DERP_014078 [Dermatophagoides pteronyssinus]
MSVNRESNLVNNKKTKTGEKKPYSANPFSILRSVPPSTNEPVELNTVNLADLADTFVLLFVVVVFLLLLLLLLFIVFVLPFFRLLLLLFFIVELLSLSLVGVVVVDPDNVVLAVPLFSGNVFNLDDDDDPELKTFSVGIVVDPVECVESKFVDDDDPSRYVASIAISFVFSMVVFTGDLEIISVCVADFVQTTITIRTITILVAFNDPVFDSLAFNEPDLDLVAFNDPVVFDSTAVNSIVFESAAPAAVNPIVFDSVAVNSLIFNDPDLDLDFFDEIFPIDGENLKLSTDICCLTEDDLSGCDSVVVFANSVVIDGIGDNSIDSATAFDSVKSNDVGSTKLFSLDFSAVTAAVGGCVSVKFSLDFSKNFNVSGIILVVGSIFVADDAVVVVSSAIIVCLIGGTAFDLLILDFLLPPPANVFDLLRFVDVVIAVFVVGLFVVRFIFNVLAAVLTLLKNDFLFADLFDCIDFIDFFVLFGGCNLVLTNFIVIGPPIPPPLSSTFFICDLVLSILNFEIVVGLGVFIRRFDGELFDGDRFDGDRFDGDRFDGDRFDGDRREVESFDGDRFDGDRREVDSFDGDRFDGERLDCDNFDGDRFDGDRFDCDSFAGDLFDVGDCNRFDNGDLVFFDLFEFIVPFVIIVPPANVVTDLAVIEPGSFSANGSAAAVSTFSCVCSPIVIVLSSFVSCCPVLFVNISLLVTAVVAVDDDGDNCCDCFVGISVAISGDCISVCILSVVVADNAVAVVIDFGGDDGVFFFID